jgi:hypothetical protein
VIVNLVINGIEAMQPIRDRPRELVIRSEQHDAQQVRVTVSDIGVGFSADCEDRLFNTFFTTKSNGMGMGLSICRSIIELHGGRIWAAPNVPHGATIQFTLPLLNRATQRDGTRDDEPHMARRQYRKYRLYVIDCTPILWRFWTTVSCGRYSTTRPTTRRRSASRITLRTRTLNSRCRRVRSRSTRAPTGARPRRTAPR